MYLAWAAIVGGENRKSESTLVAVLRTDRQLTTASAPVVLEHGTRMSAKESDRDGTLSGPSVELRTPAHGGAAVLYYNAERPETVWVSYVSPALEARPMGVVRADGGDGNFGGMLDLGSGVLIWTFAWRGGTSWGQKYFSYVRGEKEPMLTLVDCRPPMDYYFNGRELITYCPNDYRQDGERCPIDGFEDGLCARMFVQQLDGKIITAGRTKGTVPVLKQKTICRDGRWLRELTWKGGSVTYDAALPKPGAPVCKPIDRPPSF